MGVLSCLRPSLSRGAHSVIRSVVNRPQQTQTAKNLQYVIVRQMGGAHGPPKMIKTPSRAVYNMLKDEFHFFFMLGVIPVALLITGANLFIGQAELTDIPEGYQPHSYEYEKDPIKRFIARYMVKPYEKTYEQNLAFQWMDSVNKQQRRQAKKVRELMQQNQDYKAWYYVPVNKDRIDRAHVVDEIYQNEIKTLR